MTSGKSTAEPGKVIGVQMLSKLHFEKKLYFVERTAVDFYVERTAVDFYVAFSYILSFD